MRILFCIKALDNPCGGAERVLADVSGELAARGHDVTVLSYDPPGGAAFHPLSPQVRRIALGLGSTTAKASVTGTLRRMIELRRTVLRERPDAAVGFMHSMFIPLGLALAGTKIPLIASEHIVPAHYASRPLEAALLRLTPYLAQRITAVSAQARDQYPPAIRKRMVVVPNPVTVAAEGRAEVNPPEGSRRVLLSVGRLDVQKDHESLIRAFAFLGADAEGWTLRIVGEGGLRGRLEELAASHGIDDRVEFPGATKAIGAEYRAAQLFVMPSRYESFGLTVAEALAHGLPAVGFADCPGVNELIADGVNGVLVEPGNDRPVALAGALRPLVVDAAKRMRLAQGAETPPACRLDAVLDVWEELLGDVAGGR